MTNFYKDKNVLIAGGTGMIGSHLAEKLIQLGANVIIAAHENRFNILNDCYEKVDLTSLSSCLRVVEGQDYIFNLTGVKSSSQTKDTTASSQFVIPLMINTNLMDAAFKHNIKRYMCVGSINQYKDSLAAKKEGGDSQQVGIAASEGNNDRFAAQVKHINEVQALTYYLENGWDAVRMVRLSLVYGPRDNFGPIAHVIPSLINKVLSGQNPIIISGDGTNERDFIYVDDVVDGILLVMEKGKPCDPVNIGSGYGVPISSLIYSICYLLNNFPALHFDKNAPSGDRKRILDITKATQLGFDPKITLDEGLKRTIEWRKINK